MTSTCSGALVVRDHVTGHLDDPTTGRVTRQFALAPGRYRIELVQELGEDRRAAVERDFELRAAVGEQVVTLRVE